MNEITPPTSTLLHIPELSSVALGQLDSLLGQIAALGVRIEHEPASEGYREVCILPIEYEDGQAIAAKKGYTPRIPSQLFNGLGKLYVASQTEKQMKRGNVLGRCPLEGILPPGEKFIAHLPTLLPTIRFLERAHITNHYSLGPIALRLLSDITDASDHLVASGRLQPRTFTLDGAGRIVR